MRNYRHYGRYRDDAIYFLEQFKEKGGYTKELNVLIKKIEKLNPGESFIDFINNDFESEIDEFFILRSMEWEGDVREGRTSDHVKDTIEDIGKEFKSTKNIKKILKEIDDFFWSYRREY